MPAQATASARGAASARAASAPLRLLTPFRCRPFAARAIPGLLGPFRAGLPRRRALSVPRWRGRPGRGDLAGACGLSGGRARRGRAPGARRARRGQARVRDGGARGRRVPGQLRGRAPLPFDAGVGPEPMRTLPRGKARPVDIRASGAWLVGTRGLEARTACAAVARLGRAQGPAGRLRRQRGGPGSVRLARGRGHGTGARPRAGGRGRGPGRGRGRGRGRGPRLRGSLVCDAWGTGTRSGAGVRRGGRIGSARRGSLAGLVAQELLGLLGLLGGGAFLAGNRRRLAGVQEPSGGGRDAGPGTVAGGWLRGSRLRTGPGRLVVGIRLARARDDQALRDGPGGHQVFRIIPAEQAGTLPLIFPLLPRVLLGSTNITIPTRLVTFCIHHRPQSRHTFSAKYRSAPILTLYRSNGVARG